MMMIMIYASDINLYSIIHLFEFDSRVIVVIKIKVSSYVSYICLYNAGTLT